MEHLLSDGKDYPNYHKNSHKLYSEMVHPLLSLIESQLPEFPNRGKAILEQILVSQEINKSKRAGLLEPQSGIDKL